MTDPVTEWLSGFEARIADMQAKSAALQQDIAAAGATASTPDGAVRVTVGPTGALQDLQLGPSVTRYPPAELAAIITRTAGEAQRQAAHRVAAAFAPVAEGTDAMQMLESFLPPPPRAEVDAPEDGLPGVDDIEDTDETPLPPPAPPVVPPVTPKPPARRPSAKDDDDEFEQPW
ncbi:MAG: YbaB/EbfC family nucleoid-associated protein [Kibdelosporangium sp.]